MTYIVVCGLLLRRIRLAEGVFIEEPQRCGTLVTENASASWNRSVEAPLGYLSSHTLEKCLESRFFKTPPRGDITLGCAADGESWQI